MKVVPARLARQKFADLLNEVYYGGKKIVVTRSGKPMVILISARRVVTNKKRV